MFRSSETESCNEQEDVLCSRLSPSMQDDELNRMANCDSPRIKGFLLQRPIFVSVSDLNEQVELVELVG